MTTAGAWFRVSTGGQDEANQEPDVLRHCQAHSYDVTRRYEVHDRSALKGEQDSALQQMLTDIRTRQIQVVVCWHSDRLERRGVEALFKLLREVKEAGGRVESVQEPYLGSEDIAGTTMTALAGAANHQYSVHLSQQVTLAVSAVRVNGGYWGNTHWGYEITGPKYNKTLEPTAQGQEYLPQIFQRIADGQSCHKVAEWLRSGPRPGISDKTIYKMIRNPVYRGHKQDASGRIVTKVPALVSAELWQDANERLSNATRGRRGVVSGKSAFLTGILFCQPCHMHGIESPMYQIKPQNTRKDGTKTTTSYYRCRGAAPALKGCGNMVRMEIADWLATTALSQASEPFTVLRNVKGQNYNAQLTEIRLALADLPKQGLTDREEDTERQRLRSERDRLTELNEHARPSHWEEVETGETVGQRFASLDESGRREMLTKDVRIYIENIKACWIHDRSPALPQIKISSRLFKLANMV